MIVFLIKKTGGKDMILIWSKKLICDLIHKSPDANPYNKLQVKC
jgi:hypothetical protein